MTELKIKRLQFYTLDEIKSAVNEIMSMDGKLKLVRAALYRYDTQLDEAIKELASKDSKITEAKYYD